MGVIVALLAGMAFGAEDTLGPLPAGTELVRTEAHFEYLRYHLRADRPFVIELTPHREDGTPVCTGGGFDLWVRLDVERRDESFDWDPRPAVIDQACARLATHAPALPVRPPPPSEPSPGQDGVPVGAWTLRPLHAVVIPFFLLLLWGYPRDRTALGLGLLALAVRGGLSPRWVLLGGDAAYERLLDGQGLSRHDARYGDGWAAIAGLVWRGLGADGDTVHGMNLVASAATVPLVVALVRQLGGDRLAAGSAGLMLAMLPLSVALAGMEDTFVLVGLLQVAAVLGALGRAPGLPWLSALAVGLLAHLRPEQAPFCVLPLALLAWRRAWAPWMLACAVCGVRWAELAAHLGGALSQSNAVIGYGRYLEADFLARLALPVRHTSIVAWDPFATPLAVPLLAGVGLACSRSRLTLVPLAAIAISLAVYLPKDQPHADPYRFQLPTLAFGCVLAGLGLSHLWRRGAPWAVAGLASLALTAALASDPLDGGWAWQHEYRFLVDHRGEVPPGTRVVYRADQDPNRAFSRWVEGGSAGDWQPLDGETRPEGAWLYRGTADRIAGVWPPVPCEVEPIRVVEVPSITDGWVTLGPDLVEIGFYRVGACARPGTE